jgi:APA family basic amino acid/polyamine antiporter
MDGRRTDERGLGLGPATALVVGHTVAIGIFLTPAELIGSLGAPALTLGVWLAFGALVLAGALAFGELASRYPRAGGPYVYLREAWGSQVAFLYGWQCLLVMDPGVVAALAAGAAQYVAAAWPETAGYERWVAVASLWVLALVNMAGLRASARALGALTALKLIVLIAVVGLAFGAGNGSWSHLAPFWTRRPDAPPLGEALALGLVGAFFSFGGFWEASRVAGEVRDPRRTLPLALVIGVTAVLAIYLATTVAFMYLVAPGEATSAADFTRLAGLALLGDAGPRLLALAVIVSVLASLTALLMMAPRLYVAMCRDGVLPGWLAPGERDSSARATALLASVASLYAWLGDFQQIVAFFLCTALGFIALSVAGLLALRRRDGPEAGVFRTPARAAVPVSFVILVTVVVLVVGIARPWQALGGVTLVLLGLPAYRLLSSRGALQRRLSGAVEP